MSATPQGSPDRRRAAEPVRRLEPEEVRVLRALRDGPQGRAVLATRTGWARNTVAARLARLTDLGWVEELPAERGDRGRPSMVYRLRHEALLHLVLRFDFTGVTGAICTLAGEVVVSQRWPLPEAFGPRRALLKVQEILAALCAMAGLETGAVLACVIVVMGPVSGQARTVPWSKVGVLPEHLDEILGIDVMIENDANLMALGARQGGWSDPESLLFVLMVERGIGAGLALGGGVHRGLSGWAGEIGHIPVAAAGDLPCVCGNRGCLARIAGVQVLIEKVSRPDRPVEDVAGLQALVERGDVEAIMVLREAGRQVGEAILGLVIGLAPERILVGGAIARAGNHVLAGIRESLAQRMPPALSAHVTVAAAPEEAPLVHRGASAVVFERLFPAGLLG